MGDYVDKNKPMGANVKRLMIEFASADAIHSSAKGSFGNALNVLMSPDKSVAIFRGALRKVEQAIEAIKAAPDNPYGTDDEVICGAILEQLRKRDDAIRSHHV